MRVLILYFIHCTNNIMIDIISIIITMKILIMILIFDDKCYKYFRFPLQLHNNRKQESIDRKTKIHEIIYDFTR